MENGVVMDTEEAYHNDLGRIVSGGAPLNQKHIDAFDDFGITYIILQSVVEASIAQKVSPRMAWDELLHKNT